LLVPDPEPDIENLICIRIREKSIKTSSKYHRQFNIFAKWQSEARNPGQDQYTNTIMIRNPFWITSAKKTAHHLRSLPLLAVMLDKEALVRLLGVVGGEVGRNHQELGVEGQLHAQPAAAAAAQVQEGDKQS
jgi:hypothetical protein